MHIVDMGSAAGSRGRVRVVAPVRDVRTTGPGGMPALHAVLGTGPDPVQVIWLGRQRIAGIEPGRVLAVEGTLSLHRGRRTIYNPRYELVADLGQ